MRNETRGVVLPDEVRRKELELKLSEQGLTNSDIWRAIAVDFARRDEELSQGVVEGIALSLLDLDQPVPASTFLAMQGIPITQGDFLDRVTFNYDPHKAQIYQERLSGLVTDQQAVSTFEQTVLKDLQSADIVSAIDSYDKETEVTRVSFSPSGFPRNPLPSHHVTSGIIAGYMTGLVTRDIAFGALVGSYAIDSLRTIGAFAEPTMPTGGYAHDEKFQLVFNKDIFPYLRKNEIIKASSTNSGGAILQHPTIVTR